MHWKDWPCNVLSNFAWEHSPSVAWRLGVKGALGQHRALALEVEEAIAITGAKGHKAPKWSVTDGTAPGGRRWQHMGRETRGWELSQSWPLPCEGLAVLRSTLAMLTTCSNGTSFSSSLWTLLSLQCPPPPSELCTCRVPPSLCPAGDSGCRCLRSPSCRMVASRLLRPVGVCARPVGHAVVMLAVGLEEASCAQIVERSQHHGWRHLRTTRCRPHCSSAAKLTTMTPGPGSGPWWQASWTALEAGCRRRSPPELMTPPHSLAGTLVTWAKQVIIFLDFNYTISQYMIKLPQLGIGLYLKQKLGTKKGGVNRVLKMDSTWTICTMRHGFVHDQQYFISTNF